MPDFEEDIDQDSKLGDELSNVGSFDENGGLRITTNVEGESDLDEVAETIFEKEQAYVEVKEETDVDAQKNASKVLDMEGDNSGHKVQDVEQESVTKNNSSLNSYKNDMERSTCLDHFKKCDIPRSRGSILQLVEELIKVGQTMSYNMEGCITNIGDIINSQGANNETKMEDVELFNIKLCWGNFGFEFVHSPSVRNSGGEWAPNGKKLIIISVYAPQELREKKMLWDYLILVLKSWNGDVIIMGDFNEVRTQDERHGSIFNAHGADAFNLFISSAGLEEVPLDGCKFTWCHKSGSKMSKLDRFLISEGLLNSCPNISSITLDRYLSDHRPILMRESHHDYGPSPFRFFHYWFELEGFDTFVKQTWNDAQANRIGGCILEDLGSDVQSAVVAKRKILMAYEFGPLGLLDDNFKRIGFGEKCVVDPKLLTLFQGSVIVNGSPTRNFRFHRAYKQGILSRRSCFSFDHKESLQYLDSKKCDKVDQAAKKIGCAILQVPFSIKVPKLCCLLSRINRWSEIVNNILNSFTKWKLKNLIYLGRLTLQKFPSFLPINHMSYSSSSDGLLQYGIIRCHFFNMSMNGKKPLWEVSTYSEAGEPDIMGFIHKKDGQNGVDIRFWETKGKGDEALQFDFPRMYAIGDSKKYISDVESYLIYFLCQFRRAPRAGAEELQYIQLVKIMEGITLFDSKDRWRWSLEGCGEFTVAFVKISLTQTPLRVGLFFFQKPVG
ncbi:RNA-directed DNA polymerase, eukaryota [Tanacetum coccineum]